MYHHAEGGLCDKTFFRSPCKVPVRVHRNDVSNCCKFMLIDIACAIVENIVFVDDGKPLSLKRKRNKILYGQF